MVTNLAKNHFTYVESEEALDRANEVRIKITTRCDQKLNLTVVN